jgi:hypothetical protein
VQYVPIAQAISAVDLTGQNEPKPQATFVEASAQKEPVGQSASIVEPAGQYDPSEQAVRAKVSGQ